MTDRRTGLLLTWAMLAAAALSLPPALAEVYRYEGVFNLCVGTCDSFNALGGPGGAANPEPSTVSGTIEIDVGPNGSFSIDESDPTNFLFLIRNDNAPLEDAVFGPPTCDPGQLCNPATANPLPLDPNVATVRTVLGIDPNDTLLPGTATTGPDGLFNGGFLAFRFIQAPFDDNFAQVYFDLSTGDAIGRFLGIPPQPPQIPFTGIAGEFTLPGAIGVEPAPLAFPGTQIGDTAVEQVTVTNTGNGVLNVSGVVADGLSAPFSIEAGGDGCTGAALAASQSCVIEVTFAPTAGGDFAGSFDVLSNDVDDAAFTVDVTGTGLEPSLGAAPNPLAFDTVTVGTTAMQALTVTNEGTGTLSIDPIDFTGLVAPFALVTDTCSSASLAAMEQCEVTLEFSPTAEGDFMTGFTILSNDGGSPMTDIEVTGEGVVGSAIRTTLNPAKLEFGTVNAGSEATGEATLRSTGNAPVTIAGIEVVGDGAASFMQMNDCPGQLDAGGSCVIDVTFAPTADGPVSATLQVVSDSLSSPNLVALTGTGFARPQIEVDDSLNLGSPEAPVDAGDTATADLTVANSGTQPLTISAIDIGGADAAEFSADTAPCMMMAVMPGGQCVVTVTFAPQTDEDKAASLTIASDDPDRPSVDVALAGFVFSGPRVDIPESEVSVGDGEVVVGRSSTTDVTIGSNGTADLTISMLELGGQNASDFFIESEDCTAAPLPSGTDCTITVGFFPAVPGEKEATLTITSDDVTRQFQRAALTVVMLSGTAAPVEVTQPPDFALRDPGGGALGWWLIGAGALLLGWRRRRQG